MRTYFAVVPLRALALGTAIFGAGLFLVSGTAGAYVLGTTGSGPAVTTGTVAGYLNQAQQLMQSTSSLPAAPSWITQAVATVEQWFNSVMAQGSAMSYPPSLPANLSGPFAGAAAFVRNLLVPIDAWVFGITHFHIMIVFNFVFGVVGWTLGVANNAVLWLNSTFRTAAGK